MSGTPRQERTWCQARVKRHTDGRVAYIELDASDVQRMKLRPGERVILLDGDAIADGEPRS